MKKFRQLAKIDIILIINIIILSLKINNEPLNPVKQQ